MVDKWTYADAVEFKKQELLHRATNLGVLWDYLTFAYAVEYKD